MTKIALTGAAGRLGSYLREPLAKISNRLVSTDIVEDIGKLYEGEEYIQADLADKAAIMKVLEGVDMVVHFGAIVDEGPFEELLGPNFVGAYNVWEAAHQHGLKRVIYASSIHAVGMYQVNEFIGTDVPHRPDTFYGLAKCFAEDLGRMYWEKRQLESVHLRIFSCTQVNGARGLSAWLSYDDLVQLVVRSIEAPVTGFAICYGVSNNDRVGLDNSSASFLGYRPKDNAEVYADEMLAKEPSMDPTNPKHMCFGGAFAETPLGVGVTASMNIVDDTKKP